MIVVSAPAGLFLPVALGSVCKPAVYTYVMCTHQSRWDGSEEGRGEYEDLDKLMDLFNAFGQCHHVVIRHRIEIDPPHDRDDENFVRRRNSSWAIVTMADRASAERVRDAKVMAGDHQLKIAPFDNKRAVNSTGGMQVVRLKTAIDAKPPGHYVLKCDTHGVTYKIRKCNLPKLHSKKALKALMTIWDRFPTLCVSNLPTTVKNDDLQNAFSKFGQISAICVVDSGEFCGGDAVVLALGQLL